MATTRNPHVRLNRVSGPMVRVLRRLAAGDHIDWPEDHRPDARGHAGTARRLLALGLVTATKRDGAVKCEVTELGREVIAEARTVRE